MIKKVFAIGLLPFVFWLFFSQVAFWHYHILPNGIVIEHAHPFKNNTSPNTPYQKHHHSDFEYIILAQISQIITLSVLILSLLILLHTTRFTLRLDRALQFIQKEYYTISDLRAPPVI